jgi:UDP-galactopyranose mutase
MSRFAEDTNVFFLEEPVFVDSATPQLRTVAKMPRLRICTPELPHGLSQEEINDAMTGLLDDFFTENDPGEFAFWYYTPMSFSFTRSFDPALTIYDCMDELSAFKFAPASIKSLERRLFNKADVVFTGGHTLYEEKKSQHYNIHPFPSSIDKAHFLSARSSNIEPEDQAAIPGPKLGFYGVIDERFDIELIRHIATARPDWHLILIGPVVKIDPATLPQAANIHYLGCKSYQELPGYLSGWEVALIPFLLNEATKYISPTKTPEYLAAGKPVVSSAISDVVHPYGKSNLVSIGIGAEDFVAAINAELNYGDRAGWLEKVDEFLADKSWENTFKQMRDLMRAALQQEDLTLTTELKKAS